MDDQWTPAAALDVVHHPPDDLPPPDEVPGPILGELAVLLDLVVERVYGLQLVDLLQDDALQVLVDQLAQPVDVFLRQAILVPPRLDLMMVPCGEVAPQAPLQVIQKLLGLGIAFAIPEVDEVRRALVLGQARHVPEVAEGVPGVGLLRYLREVEAEALPGRLSPAN